MLFSILKCHKFLARQGQQQNQSNSHFAWLKTAGAAACVYRDFLMVVDNDISLSLSLSFFYTSYYSVYLVLFIRTKQNKLNRRGIEKSYYHIYMFFFTYNMIFLKTKFVHYYLLKNIVNTQSVLLFILSSPFCMLIIGYRKGFWCYTNTTNYTHIPVGLSAKLDLLQQANHPLDIFLRSSKC